MGINCGPDGMNSMIDSSVNKDRILNIICADLSSMNHDHLRLVVEIAQHKNFSSVAKLHNLDPSSISRIVQSVERELGVRLFQRSARHVALTDAGGAYLARVGHLLEEMDAAADAAKSLEAQPRGELRITASVAFGQACLVPLVPEFARLYPDIVLELILTDANLDMVAERIDLALRLSPRMAQDMVRVKWFESGYKICASPSYIAQHRPIRNVGNLSEHRWILFGHPQPQCEWRVRDRSGVERQLVVKAAATVSNGLAQRELALAGLGPALLPIWLAAPELSAGRLVNLLPSCRATPSDFGGTAWLLYPNRTFLPTKTRVMLEFLQTRAHPTWMYGN